MLATLELAGYVQQSADNELYHLGPRCLELAHAFARNHPFAGLARPVLETLVAETGETAHLGILREREVAHLDGVLPNQLLLTGSRVGERLPAHATAIGKALLIGLIERSGALASPASSQTAAGASAAGRTASRPESRAESRRSANAAALAADIAHWELACFTDATITDGSKLLDEIRAGQLRGYAFDLEEYAPGLHCVAAPVRDAGGRVVAAISLSGPSQRLLAEVIHAEAARAVIAAANRLSRALGARDEGSRQLGEH
ncbi:IclR family transcriptional regulator [Myxococcota bacterium]|nr:IclR family transcriptional regulator [Myxococcota bacterium]